MKQGIKIVFITIIVIIMGISYSFAANSELETEIENYVRDNNIDESSLSSSDIINIYQDLSQNYTNEEISKMITDYSDELENKGLSKNAVTTITTVLDSTSAEALNEFLETANVDEIKEELDNGATVKDILSKVNENMTTKQKVSTASKLLLSNKVIKNISIISVVVLIYAILIRGVLYKKAGRHYFTTFIPIYRDAVLLRICGYSAGWLALLLIPIIGWVLYGIVRIVLNFELAKSFGKKFGFGLGIWFFPIIFESILAFSKKVKYIEFED